ncbi:hypothetical protein BCEP4_1980022 [Burkholderia cepacia]|nr:hypothetical protein BCEP4_1980022 [Burkholderia cepacia]
MVMYHQAGNAGLVIHALWRL